MICTRDRPAMLGQTVPPILQGTVVPSELIIVDQSSVRNEQWSATQNVEGCEIRYLWSDSIGLSRARNIGLAAARNELIVFTDDDVHVTRVWLERLSEALLESGQYTIVTGQVRPGEERPGYFVPSVRIDDVPAQYEGRLPIKKGGVLWSGNMGLHSSIIERVGVFDENLGAGSRFPSSEDNDFAFRALEAGCCIRYVPEAVLYHRAWRRNRDLVPLWWGYGVGQGAYYAKHLNLRDRYILRCMIWDYTRRLRWMPQRIRRGEFRRVISDLAYMGGMSVGASAWSVRRSGR